MSKVVEAMVKCPKCGIAFPTSLFRSIWGEQPANRELVFADRINVVTCPACATVTKLPFAFMYTNRDRLFAVWYEPAPDPDIDETANGFAAVLGADSYLAAAPRIRDWEQFKATIREFESGARKGGSAGTPDLAKLMQMAGQARSTPDGRGGIPEAMPEMRTSKPAEATSAEPVHPILAVVIFIGGLIVAVMLGCFLGG